MEKQLSTHGTLGDKVKVLRGKIPHLDVNFVARKDKVNDLEKRSRRSNLMIFGLYEPKNATQEELEKKFNKEIVEEKLRLKALIIERNHGIGHSMGNKTRPIVIKCFAYLGKLSILKVSYKLKGTALSVAEDFSQHVRERELYCGKLHQKKRKKGLRLSSSMISLV